MRSITQYGLATAASGRFRRVVLLCAHVMALLAMSCAFADTPVAGAITANTTWTVANSPYVLSDEVRIEQGAYLTIQPGVIVRMSAGAGLTVVAGALSAQGLSDQPIVFTSVRDVSGQSPLPGDWQNLTFEGGTIDAGSFLSHVQIRYGSGVVIHSSSPTLSDVTIENSEGPAVEVDLAASPVGKNLSATGNLLNGILVPAGEIATDVVWALKGIPYVVADGIVHVGPLTFRLTPSRLQLAVGVTATVELSIPDPAPPGGLVVDVVSSVPSVASVPSSVLIAEGTRAASVSIVGGAVGSTTITASRAGYGTTTAVVNVVAAPVLSLTPTNGVVGIGKQLPMIITTTEIAPAGGRTIDLISSDPSIATVPASVTLPAGARQIGFDAVGLVEGAVSISASAEGSTSATASLTVRPISLNLPTQFLVAPATTRSLPITLSDPAPAGGATISLVSANSSIATVPASVIAAEGATAVNVDVTGVGNGQTTITAQAGDYQSGTSTIIVDAIAISLNPSGNISIPQGLTQAFSITLSKAAPVGGVEVSISTADPSIAAATPASVMVPQGQTVATQQIVVSALALGSTQLTASSPGLSSAVVPVAVISPARLEFTRPTTIVGKGLSTYVYELYLQRKSGTGAYAPPTPLTVNLSSADPSKVGVPTTVTIPAGQSQATFVVTGVDLTSSAITIDATAEGYATPTTKLMASVVTPTLVFQYLDGNRSVASARDNFYVTWSVPGAYAGTSQTAASAQTLTLSVEDSNPAGIVPGYFDAATGGNPTTQVTIGQGQGGSNYAYIGTPTAAGTYTVGAALTGVGNWTSATQTVANPELRFNRPTVVVGKGLNNYVYEIYLQLFANGQQVNTSTPLTVNLSTTDPSKVEVPTTVTIPAGQSQATFVVTGVDLTSSAITIDATAEGYATPTTKLMASVVTPTLVFQYLDGNRSVASARDNFYVTWSVPGAYAGTSQTAASAQTLTLSVEDSNPAGIVPGYFDAATGGNPTTQVTIGQGQGGSNYAYIGTPTTAGTYTVRAALTGVGNWTSATQAVASPELRFNRPTMIVGKGLNNYVYEMYVQQTVNGQLFNGAAAVSISLGCASSAVCSVPTTVTIPAGQSQVSFLVTGVGLGASRVIPSAIGYVAAQELDVSVITPTLRFNGLNTALNVGGNDLFTVSIETPGAYGGTSQTAAGPIPITLTSATPGVATVTSPVTIPANGNATGNATITAVGAGTTTLTASGSDITPLTSPTVTVNN